MKERTIKIVVLGIVFIAALIGFSFWTNRGNADMTADMDAATLPTLSFMVEGKEVNLLVGHKQEMNVVSMRDTIAICNDKEKLTVKIAHNENEYDSLKYEVYSLDGTEQLYEDSIDKIENIFYDFDVDKIKAENPEKFVNEIRKIKCGNRNINQQMKNLAQNIAIMEEIERDYGSMDDFVTSAPPYEIVKKIGKRF